jgi:Domain of unknown function (DUF4345)
MLLLTNTFFYVYTAALLLIGGSGLLIAPWELSMIFGVSLTKTPELSAATLVNQYRFLKGLEFAAGCFAWSWRHEILTEIKFRRTFLIFVWAGVGGRVLSILIDGWPRWPFLVFAVIEAFTGILMLRREGLSND